MHNLIRRVGDLDAKYAQAVGKRFDPTNSNAVVGMGSAVPIRDIFAPWEGAPETTAEKVMMHSMDAGVMAANVASRYALPAGGLTAAGVGLYELGQYLNGMGDQQTSGTIMV